MGAETVFVTGASGFIGSWLVMRLSSHRDRSKVQHLVELPNAETNLSLWKAGMCVEGSFDEAIKECSGVFHVATPMDFHSKDPETEVITPTIKGILDIMKACKKAETVRRIVFTSSAGTVDVEQNKRPLYDENCWSDLDFILSTKMTGWMYFVSQFLAEKEAWKFAEEHNLDLITIFPTLVVGPFIIPSMPPSLITALSPITGKEGHYWIIKQGHYVHLDDLCNAHIYLFEHPKAKGRYVCSSHDATIHEIVKLLEQKYPQFNIPTKINGIADDVKNLILSSKKLLDMGFEIKYSLEYMFEGAVKTCLAKGLLPEVEEKEPSKVEICDVNDAEVFLGKL